MENVADPKPKAKRVNFPWTDARELTLVNYVFKESGHLRTDINLADKFTAISRKIVSDRAFATENLLDGAALKKKWDRLAAAVETKYALSEEGANLSHLEDDATPTDKLIIEMLLERFNQAKAKDEQKAKDMERNEKMLTHEKNMLARQDKSQIEDQSGARQIEDLSGASVDEVSDCSDSGSKNKKSRTSSSYPAFDFEVEILKSLKEDPRLIEIEIAERQQKLEDAKADRAHTREIELRRIQAEERTSLERSKADLERSKADFAAATAQQMMMEFFSRNMGKNQ